MTDKNKKTRRDALKMGAVAAVAIGGLLNSKISAAQAQSTVSVPSLSAKMGYRIANYTANSGGSSRLGIVGDDGKVFDISAEAKTQKN